MSEAIGSQSSVIVYGLFITQPISQLSLFSGREADFRTSQPVISQAYSPSFLHPTHHPIRKPKRKARSILLHKPIP